MDAEKLKSYTEFLEERGIYRNRLIDELMQTPYIHDYAVSETEDLILGVAKANKIIPFVDLDIVTPFIDIFKNLGKTNSLVSAIQTCLHPATALLLTKKFGIGDDVDLMVASTHIGVVRLSEIFQKSDTGERKKIALYTLYLASAQARILGFKTSTTLLAMDPEDKGLLRLDNISPLCNIPDGEQLKKDQTQAIFEGNKVTVIRENKIGKFFTLK